MWAVWGCFFLLTLYMEMVFHIGGFGRWDTNPIFLLLTIGSVSSLCMAIVGIVPKKGRKYLWDLFLFLDFLLVMAQTVYFSIFKQPLLWEAVFAGGQDALTNYWREALEGILTVSPRLLMMAVPCVICAVVLHKAPELFEEFTTKKISIFLGVFVLGVLGQWGILKVPAGMELPEYEVYEEFYDAMSVEQDMGVLPMFQRDSYQYVSDLVKGAARKRKQPVAEPAKENENAINLVEDFGMQQELPSATDEETVSKPEQNMVEEPSNAEEVVEEVPKREWNEREIDWQKLSELSDNKKKEWLTDYIQSQKPTNTNEYTGLFEGYNLIFLTAEGFSPGAVSPVYTPTLYRLVNSGFVFDNYYVPLWQTSTSDGEYINSTGLIPDKQFSMKKSAKNDMAYVLPGFFKEDSVCMAYHNNTISYYDRYLSHNNLGYFFKGCMLGGLSRDQWGDHIFEMEHPKEWPASDLEMMEATVDEYVKEDRFLVYYMTVSGHLNYNFRGNAMSGKNKEAVKDLDMSETGRAYVACNIELDKALEYLLKRLEEEGKLENTVICLTADHFPYAMTEEEYAEVTGRDLTVGMDKFRNNLILWNAAMEQEPVHVDKVCGSMDVLPTLLNLFGFSYDSRMYAGRDIFSDTEGLVIFNDRSFVTDSCVNRKRNRQIIWQTDASGSLIVPEELQKDYLKMMEEEVKNRYDFSAYVLQEDYYAAVRQAMK